MMYELTELEELLNTLETSSLEPHEEYTMEFSNRRQTIILNYIKELQQQLSKQEKRWNDLKLLLEVNAKEIMNDTKHILDSIDKGEDK